MSPSLKIFLFLALLLATANSIDPSPELTPFESTERLLPEGVEQISDPSDPTLVFKESSSADDFDSSKLTHDPKILTGKTQQDGITFTYGSCFRQWNVETKAKIFDRIASEESDFWMWVGDAIYPLTQFLEIPFWPNTLAGPTEVKSYYDQLKNSKPYQALLKSTKVIGIWDDHDSGMGNGDSSNPALDQMKKLYLDFLDEPINSQRHQPGVGLWVSYYLDTQKQVKLILLDGHYGRTGEDDLGPDQMAWLRDQILGEKDSQIFIITNGYSMVNDLLVSGDKWSKWTRQEIFKLINLKRDHNSKTPENEPRKKSFFIGLSGEVHFGMISQRSFLDTPDREDDFYDLTSSGLSHHLSTHFVPDHWIGDFYNLPKDRYYGYNYGVVDIRETQGKCTLSFSLRNGDGMTKLKREFDCGLDTVVVEEEKEGLTWWKANIDYQIQMVMGFKWWHFYAAFRDYVEKPVLWTFAKVVTVVFYAFAHRWVLKKL